MNRGIRPLFQIVGAVTLGAAIAFSAISPVSAHVSVAPSTTAAGSYSLLTFAFSHGCEGSPTTQLAIQIPDSIEIARPGVDALWTIETVSAPAASPEAGEESHAAPLSEVVFTAIEPIPDGFYASIAIQVQLPEGATGETLAFPVIQTCETGETAWIQIAAEGQSGDDLESPAPTIVVTESV